MTRQQPGGERGGEGWSGRNHLKPSTQATNPCHLDIEQRRRPGDNLHRNKRGENPRQHDLINRSSVFPLFFLCCLPEVSVLSAFPSLSLAREEETLGREQLSRVQRGLILTDFFPTLNSVPKTSALLSSRCSQTVRRTLLRPLHCTHSALWCPPY